MSGRHDLSATSLIGGESDAGTEAEIVRDAYGTSKLVPCYEALSVDKAATNSHEINSPESFQAALAS